MSLDHGGHLTHGARVNFSGKLFQAHQYGVHPDTGLLNYEQVEALAREQMGGAYPLDVRLEVSVGYGRSWDTAAH